MHARRTYDVMMTDDRKGYSGFNFGESHMLGVGFLKLSVIAAMQS